MPDRGPAKTRNRVLLFGALGLALALFLVPLPNSDRSAWRSALYDLGHAPLMALITWIVWRCLGRRLVLACAIAVGLAVLVEFAQRYVGRTPGFGDLASNLSGVLVLPVGVWAAKKPGGQFRRVAGVGLALGLLLWPSLRAGPVLIDAYRGWRDFPALSRFDHAGEAARWRNIGVRFTWLPAAAGQFEFTTGGGNDIVLFPVVRDWTGYEQMCCELTVAEGPVTLQFSIRDGQSIDQMARRQRRTETLGMGSHQICFDLRELAAGGKYVPVNLRRVQSFHIIVKSAARPRTLVIRNVSLQ